MADEAFDPALAGEVVQREVRSRLARGVVHAWNNALTAILGDVRWLLEERRDDPAVARACAEIEQEAQRCARLARALQGRGDWRPGAPGEVDLAALARELAPVLRDTVSASVALAWEVPPETPWVRARRADAELLLQLAVQAVVRAAPAGAEVRITVGKPRDGHVEVVVGCEPPAADPAAPASPWDRLVADAAHALAGACEATWNAGPGRVRVRFACA